MTMDESIIFKCKSKNNTYVRKGELKFLRKIDNTSFEFGADEINMKKRFYDSEEVMLKDYNSLVELKKQEEENITKVKNNIPEAPKMLNKNLKSNIL